MASYRSCAPAARLMSRRRVHTSAQPPVRRSQEPLVGTTRFAGVKPHRSKPSMSRASPGRATRLLSIPIVNRPLECCHGRWPSRPLIPPADVFLAAYEHTSAAPFTSFHHSAPRPSSKPRWLEHLELRSAMGDRVQEGERIRACTALRRKAVCRTLSCVYRQMYRQLIQPLDREVACRLFNVVHRV
jgi:hypothetical protein